MSEGSAASGTASDTLSTKDARGAIGPSRDRRVHRAAHFAVLAAAYVLTVWASRLVSPVEPRPGPWLGPGVAIAGLLLGGLRLWPAILLASFFVNVETGVPVGVAAGAAAGNALAAVVAVLLLQRVLGFRHQLDRMWDVGALAVAAAVSGMSPSGHSPPRSPRAP
jgi:integral membrane sensor domain MASE1